MNSFHCRSSGGLLVCRSQVSGLRSQVAGLRTECTSSYIHIRIPSVCFGKHTSVDCYSLVNSSVFVMKAWYCGWYLCGLVPSHCVLCRFVLYPLGCSYTRCLLVASYCSQKLLENFVEILLFVSCCMCSFSLIENSLVRSKINKV